MDGTFEPLVSERAAESLDGHSLHIFPGSDPAFRAAVLSAIAGSDGSTPTLQQVEEMLRRAYPAARVVKQDALGATGPAVTLYVFRDGSVQPQPGDGPGTPRYVPLGVAIQREMVRSIVLRGRSVAVVESGVEALERSRAVRQRTACVATQVAASNR